MVWLHFIFDWLDHHYLLTPFSINMVLFLINVPRVSFHLYKLLSLSMFFMYTSLSFSYCNYFFLLFSRLSISNYTNLRFFLVLFYNLVLIMNFTVRFFVKILFSSELTCMSWLSEGTWLFLNETLCRIILTTWNLYFFL